MKKDPTFIMEKRYQVIGRILDFDHGLIDKEELADTLRQTQDFCLVWVDQYQEEILAADLTRLVEFMIERVEY